MNNTDKVKELIVTVLVKFMLYTLETIMAYIVYRLFGFKVTLIYSLIGIKVRVMLVDGVDRSD